MFSEGTNTVHGVIASSGTGQAVVLACLTKDKPCLDYFKLAYCWVLEPPPNKILSNILMFGSLDPGIKQAMKLVPPACKLEVQILVVRFLVFERWKKNAIVLGIFFLY